MSRKYSEQNLPSSLLQNSMCHMQAEGRKDLFVLPHHPRGAGFFFMEKTAPSERASTTEAWTTSPYVTNTQFRTSWHSSSSTIYSRGRPFLSGCGLITKTWSTSASTPLVPILQLLPLLAHLLPVSVKPPFQLETKSVLCLFHFFSWKLAKVQPVFRQWWSCCSFGCTPAHWIWDETMDIKLI